MESWTIPATLGDVFLDFVLLSILLLFGTLARRYVPTFQKYLIPNSLLAGFIGLLIGPELLGLASFPLDRMGAYVYHLLALTFIGVGLQSSRREIRYSVVNLGFMQVTVMAMQGIIGLGIGLIAALLFLPDFNPATGMLLPLGFAMGPGIAFSIGNSWRAFGFEEAASIGLSISAIGFLFAYVSGVWIITRALHRGTETKEKAAKLNLADSMRTGIRVENDRPVGSRLTFFSGAIEPLTIHIALIGLVYGLTYGLTSGIERVMIMNGLEQEVPVLWSFHFIFANILGLGLRRLIDQFGIGHMLDDGMLRRTTGACADYLITASIAAISLKIAWTYAGPVVLMCVIGAACTYWLLRWSSDRVFQNHRLERFVGMYAQMTGTISSGLALIRVTDPEYRSPVAEDLVLSSGIALTFGFPLLILINMPFTVFAGSMNGYFVVILLLAAYLLIVSFLWYRFVRRAILTGKTEEIINN